MNLPPYGTGSDVLTFDEPTLRGADSNSLLRMYDQAKAIFNTSQLQQERARVDRALRRIAKELENRDVRL
jgi:hypothetical protein